jgi:hypothetical protein
LYLVFAASPWDYEQILEDEKAIEMAEAPREVVKFINAHSRSADQQFDEEQRWWMWIVLRHSSSENTRKMK